ncbi:beta-aspartyl-peptidase [Bacillus shivajii]|uniref:beta-aspartyl-peptidase n=1 Tax=Bacillus shivajii TaxID=1983719 RepID=UPI001CFB9A5F|nr:beta-aspartyl-peptidase [Bacillus shivajii]UCZ53649.1 beta-aspartyl-peptidase [Bacillus shivajii]
MLTLIKNAHVYAPTNLGVKDVLIADKRIAKIAEHIDVPEGWDWVKVIAGEGKVLVPGFIDGHVHITGGGGEGSFHTRTPELLLTDATTSGVTTVVGVIGTDGTTRTMASLVAKARALKEEGISCYVHTGSYQIPVRTLTGKIEDDLIFTDVIIGAGEIAIADHRSSQPTEKELARIASEARIGGMLSGKKGVVNIHLGDGSDGLSLIKKVIEETNIPIEQFYPTHINRNPYLFEQGIEFAKKGGFVDFTTSTVPKFLEEGEVKSSKALKRMLDAGVPIEQMTFTSDAQGSLPDFNQNGRLIGLKVGKIHSLYEAFVEAVEDEGLDLADVLKVITINPARILGLTGKGEITEGNDADLLLLDEHSLEIEKVYALGQLMVNEGRPIVKGTFET